MIKITIVNQSSTYKLISPLWMDIATWGQINKTFTSVTYNVSIALKP